MRTADREDTRIASCQDGAVQRSGPVEDMQQVVHRSARTAPRRYCPNTELRRRGLGSTDLAVPSAVAGAGGPGPGGGDAEAASSGGQRREPEDRRAGLRAVIRRGPLRRAPVEGDQRGPDPAGEPHRGGVRGPDPDGEGAAGRRAGLHVDRQAAAGQGAGPGRGHSRREDRVVAQSPHEVLEETPLPAQADRGAAADGAQDQQHRTGAEPGVTRTAMTNSLIPV